MLLVLPTVLPFIMAKVYNIMQVSAMLAAPLVAGSFDKAKEFGGVLKNAWKAVEERIFFERLVPPVGMETISYARFMELMFHMKVKRIVILAEGTAAIVEVMLCICFNSCCLQWLLFADAQCNKDSAACACRDAPCRVGPVHGLCLNEQCTVSA